MHLCSLYLLRQKESSTVFPSTPSPCRCMLSWFTHSRLRCTYTPNRNPSHFCYSFAKTRFLLPCQGDPLFFIGHHRLPFPFWLPSAFEGFSSFSSVSTFLSFRYPHLVCRRLASELRAGAQTNPLHPCPTRRHWLVLLLEV